MGQYEGGLKIELKHLPGYWDCLFWGEWRGGSGLNIPGHCIMRSAVATIEKSCLWMAGAVLTCGS